VPRHAHVVAPGLLHAAVLQLGAAEEVAAADHDRDLGAGLPDGLRDLLGDGLHHVRVDATFRAEDLAGRV